MVQEGWTLHDRETVVQIGLNCGVHVCATAACIVKGEEIDFTAEEMGAPFCGTIADTIMGALHKTANTGKRKADTGVGKRTTKAETEEKKSGPEKEAADVYMDRFLGPMEGNGRICTSEICQVRGLRVWGSG